MELRHDLEYLGRLSDALDELASERAALLADPDRCTQLADLRDYFLYLTLDALDRPDLARELVPTFQHLEAHSRTHRKFFFTLGQLLSLRHEIRMLPREEISREGFERSWERTRRHLGL